MNSVNIAFLGTDEKGMALCRALIKKKDKLNINICGVYAYDTSKNVDSLKDIINVTGNSYEAVKDADIVIECLSRESPVMAAECKRWANERGKIVVSMLL